MSITIGGSAQTCSLIQIKGTLYLHHHAVTCAGEAVRGGYGWSQASRNRICVFRSFPGLLMGLGTRQTPRVSTASCNFEVERKCELIERLDLALPPLVRARLLALNRIARGARAPLGPPPVNTPTASTTCTCPVN